jgi:predicted nucleic acid-binding protein
VPTRSDVAYLDASALVKLALVEAETEALLEALPRWRRRTSSRLVVVEVLRAVRRRDAAAEPVARDLLARTPLIAVGDRVLAAAIQLRPASLRALDAIHLASALRLGGQVAAFVSYDARQLEAAEALGLPVASPR